MHRIDGQLLRAGDQVRILTGPRQGRVLPIAEVRMFATDNGYYLAGGLYSPQQVELVAAGDGNPCGTECDQRIHDLINRCDHCLGKCAYLHGDSTCPAL